MFPNFEALAKDGFNPIITFFHLLLRRNSHASQGVKSTRFDGSHIVAHDGPAIRSALVARAIEIAAVEKCASPPSLPAVHFAGPQRVMRHSVTCKILAAPATPSTTSGGIC
jgi:hypothetical protein